MYHTLLDREHVVYCQNVAMSPRAPGGLALLAVAGPDDALGNGRPRSAWHVSASGGRSVRLMQRATAST